MESASLLQIFTQMSVVVCNSDWSGITDITICCKSADVGNVGQIGIGSLHRQQEDFPRRNCTTLSTDEPFFFSLSFSMIGTSVY